MDDGSGAVGDFDVGVGSAAVADTVDPVELVRGDGRADLAFRFLSDPSVAFALNLDLAS